MPHGLNSEFSENAKCVEDKPSRFKNTTRQDNEIISHSLLPFTGVVRGVDGTVDWIWVLPILFTSHPLVGCTGPHQDWTPAHVNSRLSLSRYRWFLSSRSGPSGGSERGTLALLVFHSVRHLSARRVRGGIVTSLLPRRQAAQRAEVVSANKRGERTITTQVMGQAWNLGFAATATRDVINSSKDYYERPVPTGMVIDHVFGMQSREFQRSHGTVQEAELTDSGSVYCPICTAYINYELHERIQSILKVHVSAIFSSL
ncbi:hypothetical protein BDR04DRAFT_1145894 [Suillus decipiens]|nr:hypothetical protein BDR04DRAFT_1145894 [Suillus decipiens]